MKVLGSVIIPTLEQRGLTAGAVIDLPRERLPRKALAAARIGNLLWVQEPWVLVTSRRFGPQNICEALVGPVGGTDRSRLTKLARAHLHELRQRPMAAIALSRADSRCTLEIMGITEHAIRVQVHVQQVDAFLKERAQ